tara:strand:- start:443 stop:1027 length:585 start_codon:yes stop_codon:yes gene_type:complete
MRPGRKEIENKANAKIKSTYNAAHNENSVVENARNNGRNDTTSAKHSDRVKAAIKKETTGESSHKGETARVETSTPRVDGVSTMLDYTPTSSSDIPSDPSTSTKTKPKSYYAGTSVKRKFLPGYKSVKSKDVEQHYTDEQSSGRLDKQGYVPIGHGTLTKKQKRTVKKSEKEKKKTAKRDVKQTAKFTKYMENQ